MNTAEEKRAWHKAMRFAALWQEAIVRSSTVTSSAFTLPDKKAAFRYFMEHPEVSGFFPLAVAIHSWQLAEEDAQPANRRRRLFHIPHSRDPLQFFGSMTSGKLEAEVGIFVNVNSWVTLRWWFTETELTYFGWSKVPVMAFENDELWEHSDEAVDYYRRRNRELPGEVKAVVGLRNPPNAPGKTP